MDEARLRADLENWPDLFIAPASCGTGWAARTHYREILHLHGNDSADIHLTHPLIERLRPELTLSAHTRIHPGSGWATVRLDQPDALDLLLTLLSLALAANRLVKITNLSWRTPCTLLFG